MAYVRLGCIGLGEVFEYVHVPIVEADARIEAVAVADVCHERQAAVARQFDCRGVDDWRDLIDDEDIDAVLICTPHHLHAEPALAALRLGKHVLVEKPMAATVRDCELMCDAARESGAVLMVAENYYYEPGLQQIAQLIRSGAIGEVTGMRLLQANPGIYPPDGHWRWSATAGGGVVLDPGVHLLAVARWWAGPIRRVWTHLEFPSAPGKEVEDSAEILVDCGAGVLGHIAVNWRGGAIAWRYEVQGPDGVLLYDSYRGAHHARLSLVDCSTCREFDVPESHSSPESYRQEWDDFLDSVTEGREPGYPGSAGLADVALVETAYESQRTGDWAVPPQAAQA